MMTFVLLGAGALGLLYLFSRGSAQHLTPEQKQQLQVVGTPVTGKSGKNWRVMLAEEPVSDFHTMNVLAMPREFGPHELMPVLAYRQTGDNKATRVLVKTYSGVPGVAIQTAISDFGIATGPSVSGGCVGCI